MTLLLPLHVIAGVLGLLSGAIALSVTKGATLHRRSGIVFVSVMLAMTGSALVLEMLRRTAPAINIPAALLTAYLVVTALLTVRPAAAGSKRLNAGLMLLALIVGSTQLVLGIEILVTSGANRGWQAFPYLLFAAIGLTGGLSDLRMMRSGPHRGAPRLARHLWRMCVALFVAAMSFFFGQADEIPQALRIPALLALPVLSVLVSMIYWLWRIRIRKDLQGITCLNPRTSNR